MSKREYKKRVLKDILTVKDIWMYRAVILAQALIELGYNPRDIMKADKETLSNLIYQDTILSHLEDKK